MSEYISKKLAEEILCAHCNECCSEEPCEPSDCDWLNEIRQSVGVDAVPVVHGRWIDSGEDPNDKYCSVCNHKRKAYNSWWSFCPNCGAEMDLEVNND